MTKVFGESPYLKRRDYSGSDYKKFVKSKVKPSMFLSSNHSSAWSGFIVEAKTDHQDQDRPPL